MAWAGAGGGNLSAVLLDEMLDDGESQAKACVRASRGTVSLLEAIKNPRQ